MNVALSRPLFRAAAAVALLALAAPAGTAQVSGTFTQPGPGPYAWNTPAYWSSAAVPGTTAGGGDSATFDNTVAVATTVNLDDGTTAFNAVLGQLNVTTTAALTIAPGAGGSITFNNANAGATFTAGAGAQVTISAGVAVTDTVGLVVTGAGTATLSGIVSGGGPIAYSGTGSFTLSGANTFTGGLTVSSGTVNLNSTAAAGAAAGTLKLNGGTIDNTTAAAITLANNNPISVGGSFTFAGTQALNLGTGSVTLVATAPTVTTTAGTLTLGGVVSGTGNAFSIVKAGAGTLALTNTTAIVLAGATTATINGGTETVAAPVTNGANLFTKTGAGALTLGGVVGNGSGGVSVTGGTLNLANTANTFTGLASVDGATSVLTVVTDGSLGAAPAAFTANAITLTNGGKLRSLNTANATVSVNRGITVGAGGGAIDNAGAAEFRTQSLISGTGQLTLTNNSGGNFVIDNNTNLTVGQVNLSTYSGGTVLAPGSGAGAIIPIQSSAGLPGAPTSGPFGTGPLNFAGASFRATGNGAITLHNVILFSADETMQTGGAAVTFLGPVTLLNGNRTWNTPSVTVTFAGAIGDGGNGYQFIKAGASAIVLSGNNTFSGGATATAGTLQGSILTSVNVFGSGPLTLNGGNATVAFDGNGGAVLAGGNGTGALQTVALPNALVVSQTATVTVGRLATTYAPLYTTALNKTLQVPSLALANAVNLTVTNNNQYGLAVSGGTTLGATPTLTVTNATASNITPGLTLNGAVSGATVGTLTKAGGGTLLLTNAGNSFTGNVAVTGGVLGAASDTALGVAANTITLNGATAGFEAFGTFSTARTFTFANATNTNNLLLVTAGNTLTVNSGLTLTNGFQKSDPGVLLLTAAGSGAGAVTVSGGQLRVANAAALGTATVTVAANDFTAFQLAGGITYANPVTLAGTTGVQSNGALENFANSNTASGAITLTGAATIGNSAAGTLFTLSGGVSGAFGLTFNGVGDTAVTTNPIGAVTSLTRNGSGTTTVSAASTGFVAAVNINQGTLVLNQAGAFGAAAVATTVGSNGTFRIDDTGTAVPNRLGGPTTPRTLTLQNGTFQYIANAAGSTESTGALSFVWGLDVVRVDPSAAATTLTFASLTNGNGSSFAVFQTNADGTGAAFNSAANKVVFTTAPGVTNNLIPRAFVFDSNGGTPAYNFAAYNAGVVAFTGYQTSLTGAAATDTVRLAASASTTSRTINALAFGGTATADGAGTLTLAAGLVLVQSGAATFGPGLAVTASLPQFSVGVAPGASLTVNSAFFNASDFVKGLGGSLQFNTRQFFTNSGSYFTINGGTVTLNGGNQTFYPGQATGAVDNVAVGPGATLDLNGTVQTVGDFRSPNSNNFGGAGGTVTSAAATTFSLRQPSSNWGGTITGPITLTLANAGTGTTERFYNDNPYTGRTGVFGGILELTDGGRLSGTSAIDLNFSTLNVLNTSANNGRFNLTDRVPDAAPITLRGGFLVFSGRAQTDSTETVGAVTLAPGASNLTVNAGGTGINSAVLTLASLTRSSTDATLNLNGAGGQLGSNARLIVTTAPTLTNNILGGWAVNSGTDFLSYVPGTGIAAVNANGYAGYDATTITAATTATQNVKTAAAAAVLAGGLNVNSLVLGGSITFTTLTDTLNVASGGILKSAAAVYTIGAAANEGSKLTSSGGTLYLHNNAAAANTLTVNSAITDSGATPVRLVTVGYNGGLVVLNGTNTYTGGTAIIGWNGTGGNVQGITLGATGTLPAGGITIVNGLLTQTAGGVIASQAVTLAASSTLTLVGANTLASLTFDNSGGVAAPAVNTGGVLTLTGTINATSNNLDTLPVVNGTLDFQGTARTLTIAPIAYNGVTLNPLQPTLNIAAAVQNAGLLTVTGGGKLQLSGASTFTGGVTVAGTSGLVLGASSTPSAIGTAAVTSGPLGTGTLTLGSGATLLSTAGVTLANPVVVQGDLFFDGTNNVTLNGLVTVPGTAVTIGVAAPQQTVTFGGVATGSATAVTKTGYGTLVLPFAAVGPAGTLTETNGGVTLLADGDGTGTPQVLAGPALAAPNGLMLTVGRSAAQYFPYFQLAANKTFQFGTGTAVTGGIAITNNNGYGVDLPGAVAFPADASVSVATATASNVVQGLTVSGVVSGAGGLLKAGNGALVLANAGNTFGGTGKLIDIQGGIVAAGSDAALGNAANNVRLNVNAATAVGFRATGTFSTARTFTLNQAANAFEVTAGNTLTLTSPLVIPTATYQLAKNDNGVLELAAANPSTWLGTYPTLGGTLTGGVLVNAGAVRASNSAAFGNAANPIVVANTIGAQVQVAGGVTVPNPLTLNPTGANSYAGGLNWTGALRSVSGSNTWSGALQENQDSGISADAGATLTVTGGITQNAHILVVAGGGTVNVTTNPLLLVFALDKIGSGTLNIQANVAAPSNAAGIRIFAGTDILSGAAGAVAAGGNPFQLLPGGTLTLDNATVLAAGATVSRIGAGRQVNFNGGAFNLFGNPAAAVTESPGVPSFLRGQSTVTVTDAGAGTNLVFTGASNNPSNAQNNGTAPTGASVLFRGTGLGTPAGAGVATIQDTAGFAFAGQTGATGTAGTPSANKAILPWAIVDTTATGLGTSFATGDAAAGAGTTTAILRPLNAFEYSNAATLTANANQLVNTASGSVAATTTTINLNSLTFDNGTTLTLGSTGAVPVGNTLTLSSGGILVRDGFTSTLAGGVLSAPAGNSPLTVHVVGAASASRGLTVTSLLTGGNGSSPGLVKAGGGTLTVATATLALPNLAQLNGYTANTINWQTVVNQGTLLLNGGTNTLGANNFLEIGATGTVDLNGTAQYVSGLFTDGSYNGIANAVTAGGTVTNSAAATQATLVTNSDNRNWAGTITGNVFYNRAGTAGSGVAVTMYAPQTYTGGTLVNGGVLSLRDYAALTNTSAVEVSYATLQLDNTQAADLTGRLNPAAPITMRGGIFIYLGRAQTASADTVGAFALAEGYNVIDSRAGGTGVNSATLTAASLTRPAGSTATVQFGRADGTNDTTGTIGSTGRLLLTTAPTLANNLIGPWAVAVREWASYIPGLGVGQLNQTGFAGYAPTTLATAAATDNVRLTAAPAALAANTTVNTLNIVVGANTTVDLGGFRLTLAGGGLANGTSGGITTFQNGTVTSGFANGTVNDLYLHQLAYSTGSSRFLVFGTPVVDNGATPVRLVLSNPDLAAPVTGTGSQVLASTAAASVLNATILTAANTHTGGTVISGGSTVVANGGVIPAGGLALYSATLGVGFGSTTANASTAYGTIAPANTVTLNGPSTLALVGPTTLAGFVFNNTGSAAAGAAATSITVAPTVMTFTPGLGTDGRGTLTIGAAGVTASSNDVSTTSVFVGRIDTGTGFTATVNPILVNGVAVAPLQATLALQGVVGSGAIAKAGAGVLQLNAQELFTGAINVSAGGVNIGFASGTGLNGNAQGGSRFSALNLASGTFLNLAGQDATLGSLAGAGTVFNVAPSGTLTGTKTLNVGFDNSSTTFSGVVARASDALIAAVQLNKIGTGTLTLTGASTSTGTLQVSQGGVIYSSAGGGTGTGQFATTLVLAGGTLTLDNTAGNLNNRLGGAFQTGTTNTNNLLNLAGGELVLKGSAAAATTETVGTLAFVATGKSTLTFLPNAAQGLTLAPTAFSGFVAGDTGLVRGVSAAAGNGLGNLALGALGLGAATGSGTGANGTATIAIRPDLLADASPTGLGTGFAVKDSATNFLRPIAAGELAAVLPLGTSNITVNYGVAGTVPYFGSTTAVGSLTLVGASLPLASGLVDPAPKDGGVPFTLNVNSGGILVQTSAATFGASRLTTNNNVPFFFHTQANATVNGVLAGTNAGLTKDGTGTLLLNARNVYTGSTNVLEGTLTLGGGDNTLPALQTTTAGLQNLGLALGTLDLNGTSQAVASILASGRYAGTGSGGTVTNSSATPVLFTTVSAAGLATPVALTGNLSFAKTGNNALSLTGPSTYTGQTYVRGNTLTLIDSGVLSGTTTGVNVNYATLAVDQSGLNPAVNLNPQRTPAAVPVNLAGGTYSFTSGGSADYTQTLNAVNATQGHSTISVPQAPVGASGVLSIGNLQLAADATINLTGGSGGFFSALPGLNNSNLFLTSINGTPVATLTAANRNLGGNILASNGEFATYVGAATTGSNGIAYGVVTLNGTVGVLGTIAQTQYDANANSATNATLPASGATLNVRTANTANPVIAMTSTLPAGGATYNALALRTASVTLVFAAGTDVLTLASGGLALTANTAVVGSAVGNGVVTSSYVPVGDTVARLYVHSTGATFNSVVANNGATAVRLVANSLSNTLTLAGVNTYTGGTVVNGGSTVAVAAAGFVPAGGVTINNSTLTQSAAGNSATAGIAPTNDVTINGGGVLTFGAFANTLNSVTFNNTGGTATPTVTGSTVSLTLAAANAITAVNDNLATVPTVTGTSIVLSNANPTITTSTTANVPTDLAITGIITSAGGPLVKAGTGSLLLGGANTFATGVNLNTGTIILGVGSTGAVTNGPLGTGTLAMADGTALVSDGTLRTVANAVTINGNVTFGATAGNSLATTVAGNGVTLSGTVALGGTARTINVNSYLNTTTFGGAVSGTGGITKTGPGVLVLGVDNTAGYSGVTTINGGTLSATVAGSLGSNTAAGAVVFGGGILQQGGTNTTDYSARFSTANGQPIYIDTVGQTITYASPLTSATGGSLGKFGSGNLTLTATATYDGVTLINQGTLQIGATANAGSATGLLPVNTNIYDGGALLVNKSTNDTLAGVISGGGTLTKLGAGNLTVSGVNTFTGNVTLNAATPVQAGTLTITNSSALGVGPKTITVVSNNATSDGTLALDGSGGNINLAQNLSFSTSSSTGNGGILNVAGDNTIAGSFTLTSGGGSTQLTSNGGSLTILASSTITPNTTLRVLILNGTSTGANTVAALVQDGSTTNTLAVSKVGTGTWLLTNANTYTLTTAVGNGALQFRTVANVGGGASNLGAPATVANGTIALGATTTTGTLQFVGTTAQSTDRVINLAGTTGGGTLDASGTGPAATITYSNPAGITATGVGAKTLGLTGTNTGPNTLAAAVVNGSGTTSLAKSGPGLWVLTGTSTYTGTTGIIGGELRVAGNNAAAPGAVSVSGTGSLLSGTGTVGGAVSTATGGAVRGDSGTGTGTLTTGALTVTASGGLTSTIGATGTSSQVALGGTNLLLSTGSTLNLLGVAGFDRTQTGPWTIVANANATSFFLDTTANPQANGFVFGTYVEGTGNSGPVNINTASLGTPLIAGDMFTLNRNGNNLQLSFTPAAVPEPVTVGLVGAAGLGLLRVVRRRRRK